MMACHALIHKLQFTNLLVMNLEYGKLGTGTDLIFLTIMVLYLNVTSETEA